MLTTLSQSVSDGNQAYRWLVEPSVHSVISSSVNLGAGFNVGARLLFGSHFVWWLDFDQCLDILYHCAMGRGLKFKGVWAITAEWSKS